MLHPIEIRQKAEMGQFVMVDKLINHKCPYLDEADSFRKVLFEQIPLPST